MKKFILGLFTALILLSGSAYAWSWKEFNDVYDKSYEEPKYNEVAAQHILVKNAADAMAIKKELDNGASFEYYAQKYSLCPSGQNGGYLGYFERGKMVPEFEKKAFDMQVGEISNPIRTNYGWHIIKVVDKR